MKWMTPMVLGKPPKPHKFPPKGERKTRFDEPIFVFCNSMENEVKPYLTNVCRTLIRNAQLLEEHDGEMAENLLGFVEYVESVWEYFREAQESEGWQARYEAAYAGQPQKRRKLPCAETSD